MTDVIENAAFCFILFLWISSKRVIMNLLLMLASASANVRWRLDNALLVLTWGVSPTHFFCIEVLSIALLFSSGSKVLEVLGDRTNHIDMYEVWLGFRLVIFDLFRRNCRGTMIDLFQLHVLSWWKILFPFEFDTSKLICLGAFLVDWSIVFFWFGLV